MRWTVPVIAMLLAPGVARAESKADVEDSNDSGDDRIPLIDHGVAKQLRLPVMLVENLIMTLPATIYYWRTPDQQSQDWALHWDWPSWKANV